MALSRWSPMGELAGLHTAMDRLFSDFVGGPLLEGGETASRTWYLPIDVVDQGQSYEVKAAVPGFSPEEVDLTYSDGILSITAQHRQESSSKQGSYLRRELSYGSFARSVQLPGDVKEDQIKASFENGNSRGRHSQGAGGAAAQDRDRRQVAKAAGRSGLTEVGVESGRAGLPALPVPRGRSISRRPQSPHRHRPGSRPCQSGCSPGLDAGVRCGPGMGPAQTLLRPVGARRALGLVACPGPP